MSPTQTNAGDRRSVDGYLKEIGCSNGPVELAVKDNAPKPILLGRHLIEIGIQPGSHFGPILDRCYEAQLDGAFTDEAGGKHYLNKIVDKDRAL